MEGDFYKLKFDNLWNKLECVLGSSSHEQVFIDKIMNLNESNLKIKNELNENKLKINYLECKRESSDSLCERLMFESIKKDKKIKDLNKKIKNLKLKLKNKENNKMDID